MQWLLQYAQHNVAAGSGAEDVQQQLLLQAAQGHTLALQQQPTSLLACMLQRGHVLCAPPPSSCE